MSLSKLPNPNKQPARLDDDLEHGLHQGKPPTLLECWLDSDSLLTEYRKVKISLCPGRPYLNHMTKVNTTKNKYVDIRYFI